MIERLSSCANFIKSKRETCPKVGLVLGSGLGAFVEKVENKIEIPYSDIPHFHPTTVEGHEGRLILGTIRGIEIVVMQGRLHVYEGHDMQDVVFPIRVLATLGIETLFLTNAAGGINFNFSPGELVIIKDHINLMGKNPLIGPNYSELGPRFPDMTQAYNKDIRELIHSEAKSLGVEMKDGVYAALTGPTYETPAEIKMLRVIGADMVGMSTVPESIAANHFGIKVAGISCITNMAAGIENKKLHHGEIKEQALKVMDQFSNLLVNTISKLK